MMKMKIDFISERKKIRTNQGLMNHPYDKIKILQTVFENTVVVFFLQHSFISVLEDTLE